MPAKESDRFIGRPGICRACGALVASGETECAQCGAPLDAATATRKSRQPAYDRETMTFARAILGRPATFTVIFLVANVLFFVLMTFSGGSDNPRTLIAYGAKLNSLINERGEWWRFVTPMFLHAGVLHLLFNMYGLWIIGPYVEKLYGSAKFVVFWVLSGIAGVVASYLSVRPDMHVSSLGRFFFKSGDPPSVGASGALFGLIGVLFVFGIRFRHELPEGFKRAFGTGMLPIIVINLFIGFLGRNFIDNSAHLGGLVCGALLALVVGYKRPGPRGSVTIVWHVLQVCALGLVVGSFFMVWRHYNGPRLSFTASSFRSGLSGTGGSEDISSYLDSINEGRKVFNTGLKANDTKPIDDAISKLTAAPHVDDKADAFRNDLKTLLERARSLVVRAAQKRDTKSIESEARQLELDYQSWEERFLKWAGTDGEKYKIVIPKRPEKQNSETGK